VRRCSKKILNKRRLQIIKEESILPNFNKGKGQGRKGGNMIIANRFIRILIATICVFLSMAVIAYAMEDYNKAIQLNPNDAVAYNNRGNAYHAQGQYDRAIEDYNKAIQLNPNYAQAYAFRGAAYVGKGQYDRAISDFQKACDMGHAGGCKVLQMIKQSSPK
jgi:tetratricopeptide (TPR) repeat protein